MDTKGIRIEDTLRFKDKRSFNPRFVSISDVKIDNDDIKLERQEDLEKRLRWKYGWDKKYIFTGI